MLRIYLARHGQDEDNANGILNGRRNLPLTQVGIEQAHAVAHKIKTAGIVFNNIYTSPLLRTQLTAQIIADSLDMKMPDILEDLIERDFGVMTGLPHTKIKELCVPDILETQAVTYFLSPLGAETFPDLLVRAQRLLAWIQEKHNNGAILLVTHGDIGKMIYCAYYNLEWEKVLPMFHFANTDLLLLAPDSLLHQTHVFSTA